MSRRGGSAVERVDCAVRTAMARYRGARVVVAVSGGGDSVALLRALHAAGDSLGLTLTVAHLDHGLRGDDARADAEFIRRLAHKLGLQCDIGRWSPMRAGHIEADARRARYAWLSDVTKRRVASLVAVGHTRDDQAETILHRILRGTGVRGLAGIPAARLLCPGVALVRPLLNISRADTRAYLSALGQDHREDATNVDCSRTRARIRHKLLPLLAQSYNPRVTDALVRLGSLAAAAERGLRIELRRLEGAVRAEPASAQRIVINRRRFKRVSLVLRSELLRHLWREAGWPEAGMDARRWRRLAALVRAGTPRTSVRAGVELECRGAQAVLLRRAAEAAPRYLQPIPLELPGSVSWSGGRVVATLTAEEARDETIDLDSLALPLEVRESRLGERFRPLGMTGEKSLNDFLRGRRVPASERSRVPLVCDQQGIVWVVGHRIDQRVRITNATRRGIGLRWEATAQHAGSDS